MRTSLDRGRRRLELIGELDLSSAELARAQLEEIANGGGQTLVDLTDLRFIDSTGIAVLFAAVERASAEGREIVFTRASNTVERTLHLTGLDQILSFDASPGDAELGSAEKVEKKRYPERA